MLLLSLNEEEEHAHTTSPHVSIYCNTAVTIETALLIHHVQ